jgi:hypothetical protein
MEMLKTMLADDHKKMMARMGALYSKHGILSKGDDGLPRNDGGTSRGKEEPASEEMKPEVEHQEVPKEDAAVMPVRGLRKQRRGPKACCRAT